jgi:hypothetical protein
MQSTHLKLAKQIADLFAPLPQVEAVALAGSRGNKSGSTDNASDIDLYVYTRGDIPLEVRESIVQRSGGASRSDLNLNYWGPGDEWINTPTGIEVDIVYFDATWMEDQITRVIDQHQASMGYTTCFWHTIRQSNIFFDPHHWLAYLQQKCQSEYPEPLRRNIITLNHPVLRGIIPSYAFQIEKAVKRGDLVSINHRLAALLASYFDILFALNRQLHPGEKRLVEFAVNNCLLIPANLESDITSILQFMEADIPDLPTRVNRLLDQLDTLLVDEGLV